MSSPREAGWDPVRLYPGDAAPPDVAYVDDDWFRFYGPRPGTLDGTTHLEVHELCCTRDRCGYRPEPCAWHPAGCECSSGECQR